MTRKYLLSPYNLRSRVVWAAATCTQEVAIRHDIRKAKVRNFDIVLGIEKDVFRLEIPRKIRRSDTRNEGRASVGIKVGSSSDMYIAQTRQEDRLTIRLPMSRQSDMSICRWEEMQSWSREG